MSTKYPNLFSPITIRGITLRNRIYATPAMSAWPEYDGGPSINCIYDYVARAQGGAAIVNTGETTINRNDGIRMNTIFLTQEQDKIGTPITPVHLHGKMVEGVNRHGAIAAIQLYHAGEAASEHLTGGKVMGPMGYTKPDGTKVRAMNEDDMAKVCDDFENAARIALECGYQIMQIHCGHGWLLSQFLSPLTNQREDEYGGSLENRAKFPIQIIDAVRRGCGDAAIIELRISGEEHVEGGMHIEEVADFIKMVEDKIDLVQISAGCFYSSPQYTFPSIFQEHGLNVENAAYVKERVSIPVAVVGGLTDPAHMEQILAEGKADLVCMSRQLFADPELPMKVYEGREDDVLPCLRCSNCLGMKGAGHHGCDINPMSANGSFMFNSVRPVAARRRVLVVGGGPAGMKAAITACDRGHEVIIVDKASALGGALRHTDLVGFKSDIKRYKDYLINQVSKRDITVMLDTPVTEELVDELVPDRVICAVGASSVIPEIPGMDKIHVMDAIEANDNESAAGKRVVVIGSGLTACETALHLAHCGHEVTLVSRSDAIAKGANVFYQCAIMEQIEMAGIEVRKELPVKDLCEEGAIFINADGETELIPCDTVVLSVGMKPNREIAEMLRKKIGFAGFRDVGDCIAPKNIRQATHSGFWQAWM